MMNPLEFVSASPESLTKRVLPTSSTLESIVSYEDIVRGSIKYKENLIQLLRIISGRSRELSVKDQHKTCESLIEIFSQSGKIAKILIHIAIYQKTFKVGGYFKVGGLRAKVISVDNGVIMVDVESETQNVKIDIRSWITILINCKCIKYGVPILYSNDSDAWVSASSVLPILSFMPWFTYPFIKNYLNTWIWMQVFVHGIKDIRTATDIDDRNPFKDIGWKTGSCYENNSYVDTYVGEWT